MGFLDNDGLSHFWSKVKAALSAKQNKLTGTPGQVVGFGADGGAQVVQGWSNPNLLINSDFRRPVNRNGKPEYTSASHTIDQWRIGNGTVSLVDGRIVVQHSSGTLCVMQQLNQELYKALSGKTVTISLLLSDGLLSATGTVPDGDDDQEHRVTGTTGFGCEICLYKSGPRKDIAWQILLREQNSVSLIAAKLELGPAQTLAYQDTDGNWVLNDPPNYDLQYAHCSLYSPITGAWVGSQHSNPNLLDNWYFGDPVNQKGNSEYGQGIGVDRWHADGGMTIEDGYISVNTTLYQTIPVDEASSYLGKQLTLSLLTQDGKLISGTNTIPNQIDPSKNLWTRFIESDGIVLGNYVMKNGTIQIFRSSGKCDITAVKTELGPVQTLAHQDADGSWVLNDPPPNKALELAKCQRYFVAYRSADVQNTSVFLGGGVLDGLTSDGRVSGQGYIVLPCTMRATPVVVGSLNIYNSIVNAEISKIDVLGASGNVLRFNFTTASTVSLDERMCLIWCGGGSNRNFLISSDI